MGDAAATLPQFPLVDGVIRGDLPVQQTSLIGRDDDVARVGAALRGAQLVTLSGPGGCGKTRLALQVATELDARLTRWWVELAPVSDLELVAVVALRSLGLWAEAAVWAGRPPVDTLVRHLRGTQGLIVLDNCEHVLDEACVLAERVVQAAPGVRVLTTSREPLGAAGEVVWRVPPLDEESAVRLFMERSDLTGGCVGPEAEIADVRSICRRLDGIPLAIELAAARTSMMSPSAILASLDDRLRLLTGGRRTAPPRQQTLEASIGWSYALLEEPDRALLRRLSVFAGGFTLEGAGALGGGGLGAVLDGVARLVDKSLVHFDPADGEDRYRLLETVRLFGRDRLLECGEVAPARNNHLAFYVELAEGVEPLLALADGPVWLGRLEREHDNLRAALDWAEASGARRELQRLSAALALFWELRGHLGEASRWLERALAGDESPSVARARALWGAAHVAVYRDDFAEAARRAPEALAAAEAVSDRWAGARAQNALGFVQWKTTPELGRQTLARSVQLGREIGDDWSVADGLKMITAAWLVQENHDAVKAPLEELHREAERMGNRFFIAWYQCATGWSAVRHGELDRAQAAFDISLEHCRTVGEPATAGVALAFLAEVEALRGDYEAAEARLRWLLRRATATGAGLAVPFATVVLATVRIGVGDAAGVTGMLEGFVDQVTRVGVHQWRSWGLSLLGACRIAAGDLDAADAALTDARDTARGLGNVMLEALAAHHLGRVARRRADQECAEDLHHQALAQRAASGFRPAVADSLEALAGLAATCESGTEGLRLFGAAQAIRQTTGCVRFPAAQADYDDDVSLARAGLDTKLASQAWNEGTAMSIADVVAYAARGRGERGRPSHGWASLTPAEIGVVRQLVRGSTTPQIAAALFISTNTVKAHLSHVFTKLGVRTRAELAAEAVRRGL